jgi:pyroglutamyl-peptidase
MQTTLPQLLITGFTPFDGRTVNGSWIAAQTYASANHLEIPVIWGKPLPNLEHAVKSFKPEIVISLGEGREGWFDIETQARNQRKHRPDNLAQYPNTDIIPGGPPSLESTINTSALHKRLEDQQIPIRISADAGQFLCEETLYCLEHLKTQYDSLRTVVFVHLPPFGTSLTYRGEGRVVDTDLLEDFVLRLVIAVREQNDQLNLFDTTSHQTKNRG